MFGSDHDSEVSHNCRAKLSAAVSRVASLAGGDHHLSDEGESSREARYFAARMGHNELHICGSDGHSFVVHLGDRPGGVRRDVEVRIEQPSGDGLGDIVGWMNATVPRHCTSSNRRRYSGFQTVTECVVQQYHSIEGVALSRPA